LDGLDKKIFAFLFYSFVNKNSTKIDAKIIAGIQQLGIGVSNLSEAREWYKKILGYDVIIFDEAAEASLMVRYTDNKPQKRHAILAFNMKSGGGFEVWQYTSRKPVPANFDIQLGD